MNKVVLMGRLTRDPEVRYTQGDNSMAIAHYTLAVDRRRGRSNQQDGQPTADFISCVAFGKAAEHAEKYYHKGIKICVSGRIQTGSYTNKDGVKVYTTDVVVEEQEFAESRNSQGGQSALDYSSFSSYGNNGSGSGSTSGSYSQSRPAAQNGNSGNNAGSAPSSQQGNSQEQPSGAIDGFMNIPDGIDEELPFN